MILTSTVDTYAREFSPSANYGTDSRLYVNGGGSTDARQSFIYFPKPFPANATVVSATLRLHLANAWSGTNNLTAKRVTTKWAETTLTWSARPTVTTTHSATATVTGGADQDVVSFDVTDMLQDVASGGAYFGFRLELSQHALRGFYSSEWGDATLRPTLELTWSEAPEIPDRLAPDGDLAVSEHFPILSWRFADKSGNTVQASAQVQLNQTTDDFSSPDYDTGKIALAESQWDSDDGSFTGIDNGETWYWRVKVWDGTDFASDWSESAEFNRTNLGSLSIDNPGATVPETTPPIEWTLTGSSQESYRVTLSRINADGSLTQLWQTAAVDDTTDSVTPDPNLIRTGDTYRATVEVWDDEDRYGDDHLTATQDFTYALDGTPDPVDSMTVVKVTDEAGATAPAVQIDWSRSAAPDAWCLVVDGVEVLDNIDLTDTHVSGDDYRLIYWGATPRQSHTYEIRAVVTGVGMSNDNPTADLTTHPAGIWLADDSLPAKETPVFVCVYDRDEVDLAIGETGTTYFPVGSKSPVRITDIVRGYEGSVTGALISMDDRDTFLAMKALDSTLRLVLGDLSIPVRIEEAHVSPTSEPGDDVFRIGFNFFQDGEPWPVDA